MSRNWTNEQLAAINSSGQNLLLSAAAGSGKTAVLVERIISRITDKVCPVDADRLLVVTFTNAAANEMRERIIASLEEKILKNPQDANLSRQLVLVKKAQITTIDSFCINVLRNHFVEADLPPDFSVADPTECKVMLENALDEVINEMYDDEVYGGDFLDLMESYSNSKANDINFRGLLISLYYFVTSLPYPEKWLKMAAEKFSNSNDFENSEYKDVLIKEAHSECERCISEYNVMINLAAKDGFSELESFLIEERSYFENCININDYDKLRAVLNGIVFKGRPRASKNMQLMHIDQIADMRQKIKTKRMGVLTEKLLNLTSAQQAEAINKMYPLVCCLSELIKRLSDKFEEAKLRKNMLDFSDCEHRCLNILTKDGETTQIAKTIRDEFDEIYIDEYQDTSKLQEAIFSSIKKENNLFMVGDIKQSIYRFRNTDPILFKTKRDRFSKDEDSRDRKIILSKNFRSRENILDSVNYIFERIMSVESGEIDYNDDEKLYLGADYPDTSVNPISYETEVAIIDTKTLNENSDDDYDKIELEAIYCAKRIAELIKNEVQIYDKGEYRKITYKDICIVSRNVKDNAVILSSVFADFGIPCYAEKTGGYFNSREVEIILALLSVIDNPYQDLPLLTVLRSIIFNVSSETLAKIRSVDKRNSFYDAMLQCAESDMEESAVCCEIIKEIEKFSEKSRRMSVSQLILEIYNRTGFFDAQQSFANGTIRKANLRLLYNRAKDYENTGLRGLYSFIKFIQDYKNTGNDLESAKLTSENNDAVRIMSIHKSKGLEFPVVILFAAEHQFNLQDLRRGVLYHPEIGYGPKFVDTNLRITYNFAPRAAVESVLYAQSIAEEMRILYVALTRAKEKLIIIGADKNIEQKIRSCTSGEKSLRIGGSLVSEHISYLDWIIMALINHKNGEVLRKCANIGEDYHKITHSSRFDVKIISDINELSCEDADSTEKETRLQNENDSILSLIMSKYHSEEDVVLPSKVTVSELKKRRTQEVVEDGSEAFKRPAKIKEKTTGLSASEIGIAYHTVLQKYDISAPLDTKEDIKKQIDTIKEKGFLTEEEAGAVSPEKLLKFFTSGTGRMIRNAKEVKREFMFGVSIPAKGFLSGTESDKDIMLQGIIDCLLITDEGLVVIDYKTDRNFDETETVEKYRIQLECYKYAAEKIFKKPVISKILFMLDSGMAMTL